MESDHAESNTKKVTKSAPHEKGAATRRRNNIRAGRWNGEKEFEEILMLLKKIIKEVGAPGTRERLQAIVEDLEKHPTFEKLT